MSRFQHATGMTSLEAVSWESTFILHIPLDGDLWILIFSLGIIFVEIYLNILSL